MSKFTLVLSLAFAALAAGCAVGPTYTAPTAAAPVRLDQAATPLVSGDAPAAHWWAHFRDPVLTRLVHDALARNHDLRVAAARLAEARSLRRATLWRFAPSGGAAVGRERGRLSALEAAPAAPQLGETWSAGFDAAWELDLFGRTRRAAEEAAAEEGAVAAEARGVQVAMLAELAATYFGLRGTEEAYLVVQRQLVSLRESHGITERRVGAGRGTPLDTARTEALLRETEALLPMLERDSHVLRHRLAVLLGLRPGELDLAPAALAPLPAAPIAIGTPGTLLRRRPDVSQAERLLAAATARVGVDTAALFPEVSITGVFRFVGLSASDLGDRDTRSWAVAPTLRWRLLDYGALRARLAASQARAEGALARYEATVLRALEDTENALARYRAALARAESLTRRQAAAERARVLAVRLHEAGGGDPLAWHDAERVALAAERDLLAANTECSLALVALYKALGGGEATAAPVGT